MTELNIAGQPPVKPCGVSQSVVCGKFDSVMMSAFSTPTKRPLRSNSCEGTSTAPPRPTKRRTPRSPVTRPLNVENEHVAPASSWPMKRTVPWQPAPPPSSPVARNLSGPLDGVFVTPGVTQKTPVGATCVPAHVHVVAASARSAVVATATAAIATAIFARPLITASLLVDRRGPSALPGVHVASPSEESVFVQDVAQRLDARVVALGLGVGEVARRHDGGDERGDREVGDAEAVAHEVAVRLQLAAEALAGEVHLLQRVRDALVVDAEHLPHARPHEGELGTGEREARATGARHEGPQEETGVGQGVVDHEQARIRAELLVEEVLEIERPAALLEVRGVERRVRVGVLEVGDDARRIADRVPVLDEDGEGGRRAARQLTRELAVPPGNGGLADVGDALVVERPADLLVVVRDLEVVEDGRLAHRSASASA